MTLPEAIKSGKKFKRPCWSPKSGHQPWLTYQSDWAMIRFENTDNPWTPRPDDLTATDWEVKDPLELWLLLDEKGHVVRGTKHYEGTNLPRDWKRVFVKEAEAPPPF